MSDKDPQQWINEETVKNCVVCQSKFSFVNRKHHCRACGQVFCDRCTSKRLTLPSHVSFTPDPYTAVRVCDQCYELHKIPLHSPPLPNCPPPRHPTTTTTTSSYRYSYAAPSRQPPATQPLQQPLQPPPPPPRSTHGVSRLSPPVTPPRGKVRSVSLIAPTSSFQPFAAGGSALSSPASEHEHPLSQASTVAIFSPSEKTSSNQPSSNRPTHDIAVSSLDKSANDERLSSEFVFRETIARITRQYEEEASVNERLKADLSSERTQNKSLLEKISSLMSANALLQGQLHQTDASEAKDLCAENMKLQLALEEKTSDLERTQAAVARLTEDKTYVETELAKSVMECSSLSASLKQLREELESKRALAAKGPAGANEAAVLMKNENQRLMSEVEELKTQIGALSVKLARKTKKKTAVAVIEESVS